MKTEQLNYNLPAELIAQQPADKREKSRLLVLDKNTGEIDDLHFEDIAKFITPKDCLVLNNTKVLPARFYGCRKSGAKLEGLFLTDTGNGWDVMLKNARKVKDHETIILLDTQENPFCDAVVEPYQDGRRLLKVAGTTEDILAKIGYAPLPPYIKRTANDDRNNSDRQRYQTVFAQVSGAVAAPTAGLHFTEKLLADIENTGTKIAHVTLHTGAGTFKPVTADDLADHDIHSEWYDISKESADIINNTKQNNGKIIAVGTTSVRTLESATKNGKLLAKSDDTKLFITPGYKYKTVDAMITNFHLPKSTLLALVGAFAGTDNIFNAYRHAVKEKYRFFSYGDAMLIL